MKKLPEEVSLPANGTASELYTQLATRAGTTVHRLRVTKGSDGAHIPNSKDLSLSTTGLREQSTIYVKDLGTIHLFLSISFCHTASSQPLHSPHLHHKLTSPLGPQIAWRTVFLVEYLGPLLIHPALYLTLPYTSSSSGPSSLQTLTLILILLHFLKRELETLFIHRFSSATMPLSNIFKNSAHYWLLSGLNMAYWIYLPTSPTAQPSNPSITYPGLALFLIGELGNLNAHLVLRNLRSSGGAERGIPKGLGFDVVTCPNYMFEAMAWVGIALVSWNLSTVLFAVVAVGQMGVWAGKKEERYRRDFGNKYKAKRSVMLPGIW